MMSVGVHGLTGTGARQWATGGKAKLLGISKRGIHILRKMFIHGARAAVLRVKRVKCTTQVPKDFARAIFFDLDPPIHDGIDIASVVGGESNFLRLLLPQ
jgi:hypothetical protein